MVNEYDFHGVKMIMMRRLKTRSWDNVSAFYEELYQQLKSTMGKPLRIVCFRASNTDRKTEFTERPHLCHDGLQFLWKP